jgi:hypothetical protein
MAVVLPDGCIEALGIAALVVSIACLSLGFYIAVFGKCGERSSTRLPLVGYLCKDNLGMAYVSTGIVALGFFVSNVFLAQKINAANIEKYKLLTEAADELRRSVSTKTQFDEKERAQIDFLIRFIQRIDPKNGHGFYFAGTLSRINQKKAESWPHFFRYLEMQRALPESERGGDTGSEICYERARGFCPQRIAFVRHMLANDFYDEGKAAAANEKRREFYTRAFCQTELLLKSYPGGFVQFTPTSVIRSETLDDLRRLTGNAIGPSCGA